MRVQIERKQRLNERVEKDKRETRENTNINRDKRQIKNSERHECKKIIRGRQMIIFQLKKRYFGIFESLYLRQKVTQQFND